MSGGLKERFIQLPQDFLWGSGTSAFQVEGNVSGERRTDWDDYFETDKGRKIVAPAEIGPNWWSDEEAEKDFARVAKLGLNAQRFGIEWARIVPEPGVVSREAIKRYRRMVDRLHSLDMLPMTTLFHTTLPLWLAKRGGWQYSGSRTAFGEFAKIVANEFGDIPVWLTINEPNLTVSFGYLNSYWPPGKSDPKAALHVYNNLIGAHREAHKAIKEVLPEARVGNANAIWWLRPENPKSASHRLMARLTNYIINLHFVSKVKESIDFVGVNFYNGYYIKFKPQGRIETDEAGLIKKLPFGETKKPDVFTSDFGWPIVPDFFLDSLSYIYKKFRKPIIITENGIADEKDLYRPFYILTHIVALHEAVKRGVDLKGYFHWTTVDNLEWREGFKYHFGLIGMDPKKPDSKALRRSARLYGEIARSEVIDVNQLVEKYIPNEQKREISQTVSRLEAK